MLPSCLLFVFNFPPNFYHFLPPGEGEKCFRLVVGGGRWALGVARDPA